MKNYFQYIHNKLVSDDPEDMIGSGYEEIFTRQFAFFLNSDRLAANTIVDSIVPEQSVKVQEIECEKSAGSGRIDIEIILDNGKTLLLENKVDSKLGKNQLQKYLNDDTIYLAVCSHTNLSIDDQVKNDERYCYPTDPHQPYYYWSNIYSLIKDAPSPPEEFQKFRIYFLNYMRSLAMAPTDLPETWRKLFKDRTVEENRRVKKDFGKCLEPAMEYFRDRGHVINTASHKTKVIQPVNEDAPWRRIRLGPSILEPGQIESDDFEIIENMREVLEIKVTSYKNPDEDFLELYEHIPSIREDPTGETWRRLEIAPHSRKKKKFGMARKLKPLVSERKQLPAKLEEAIIPTLEIILEKIDYEY